MTHNNQEKNAVRWDGDVWFVERSGLNPGYGISLTKDRIIFRGKSEFQEVEIFENRQFGRVMLLDNLIMVTEKDEFVYHEMIVHVPMCVNPAARRILVIGAGDGGTVRELVKYPGIKQIDMVEIDKMVCDVARDFLPTISNALDHKKVRLLFEDGAAFVKTAPDKHYDLIIVDSTDPVGPGEVLFREEFYRDCFRTLKDDGIMINQNENPFFAGEIVKTVCSRLKNIFPSFSLYYGVIPTYPGALWLFGFSSKKFDPVKGIQPKKWNSLRIDTKYYNTELHASCFTLPTFVKKLFE